MIGWISNRCTGFVAMTTWRERELSASALYSLYVHGLSFLSRCVKVCKGKCVVQVTGLMTQGRADGSEWVTSYLVSYSIDAYHWVYVNDYYGNRRVRISNFYAAFSYSYRT